MLGTLLSLILLLPAGISPVSHNVLMHFLALIGAVQVTLKYLLVEMCRFEGLGCVFPLESNKFKGFFSVGVKVLKAFFIPLNGVPLF